MPRCITNDRAIGIANPQQLLSKNARDLLTQARFSRHCLTLVGLATEAAFK